MLLGYTCKKAIITYTANVIFESRSWPEYIETSTIVWYAPELKEVTQPHLAIAIKSDRFTLATRALGGLPLYEETIRKGIRAKAVSVVTEVSTDAISDSVFVIKNALCEQPENIREYKKALMLKKQKPGAATH
jgi:hypothetical protein